VRAPSIINETDHQLMRRESAKSDLLGAKAERKRKVLEAEAEDEDEDEELMRTENLSSLFGRYYPLSESAYRSFQPLRRTRSTGRQF
jgi:hypothetical protein